jgi:hypothetical protein
MPVGAKRFLDVYAIYLINGQYYINTNSSAAIMKDELHRIPIERIGTGKGDFEIDFFVTEVFSPEFTKKQATDIIGDEAVIRIEGVETEVYESLNYRSQMYPRKDWEELMTEFIRLNEELEINTEGEIALNDKIELKKWIKKKIAKFDSVQLEEKKKEFSQPSEAEKELGRVNLVADDEVLKYINTRIAQLEEIEKKSQEATAEKAKELKDMTTTELEEALKISIKDEEYTRSSKIRDEIARRSGAGVQETSDKEKKN